MEIKIGDIFTTKTKTIVNTVNCVGVMGKGIALEFKKRYPLMFEEYKSLCKQKKVIPGRPYYYTDLFGNSIINFPTKDHWKSPSKLSYIIDGLDWFVDNYKELGITSIAFPPLGCGNGGLSWELVGPIMYEKLKDLPIEVEIYAPYGTKENLLTIDYLESHLLDISKEVVGAQNSTINKYWYLALYVIQQLNRDKYSLNVGRTIRQKIFYTLTRAGIPTGFTFVRNTYGPYCKEVDKAIVALSNANLLTEVQLGKMVETKVADDFKLDKQRYSEEELAIVDKVIDLLSRVKDTSQAEMLATVMFSYDQLVTPMSHPTEKQIVEYVLEWKKRWKENTSDIIDTVKELSELEWIEPDISRDSYIQEEYY